MSAQVDGDPKAPILLIGMAPGKEELRLGAPFVGGSGWLLWTIAKAAGITRADCYIVNVIGEWPALKSGSPSAAQIMKYRSAFEDAVGRSAAEIAIVLGGDALRGLTGLEGIEDWRGYLIGQDELPPRVVQVEHMDTYKRDAAGKYKGKYKKGDPRVVKVKETRGALVPSTVRWIIPTLHPAAVLRTGKKTLPAFKADVERAGRAWRNELWAEPEFLEAREGVIPLDGREFCVDIETTPYLRIGMAGRHNGEYAAWSKPLDTASRAATLEMFERGTEFIAHNAPFDLVGLAEHGMVWNGKVFCTLMAASLLQPDLYKGLNAVTSLYFDTRRWKHKAEADMCGYNLLDAKKEYRLYEVLKPLLQQEGMLELFENVTMQAMIKALVPMTKRGLAVHPQRREAWLAEVTEEYNGHLAKWQGLTGNVNPASPKQLLGYFYGKLKLPMQYSKKGGETAERQALYALLANLDETDYRRPIVTTLMDLRKASTLLKNFAKRPVGDDGCIHPHWLPITKDSDSDEAAKGAAGTGRLQARPNVQQLPQVARRMIIPHDPARQTLASFDFKQLELRIAASLSGDARLQRTLELTDPFADIMAKLGCNRTLAKNYSYGSLYLGGPRAIVFALRGKGIFVQEKEVKTGQQAFFEEYRDLWRWRQEVIAEGTMNYALRTPMGNKRYFYGGSRDAPAMVSFMCQGTAAYIIWYSLAAIEQACNENHGAQLASIHDEALTEFDNEYLPAGITAVSEVLTREWPMIAPGFRVPIEAKVGPSWGEMLPWTGKGNT